MFNEVYRKQLKLSGAIAEELRNIIINNKMETGSRFYSETEIGEKWSCSRATAREALLLLEFEGLIISKPGPNGGIFVQELSTTALNRTFYTLINANSINPKELVETRIEIESLCAGLAAKRATPEDLDIIKECMCEFERTIKLGKIGQKQNMDFHMAIVTATHNRVLIILMKVLETIIYEDSKQYEYTNEQKDQLIYIHRRIYDAIASGDSEAARRRMERHLVEFANVSAEYWAKHLSHRDDF